AEAHLRIRICREREGSGHASGVVNAAALLALQPALVGEMLSGAAHRTLHCRMGGGCLVEQGSGHGSRSADGRPSLSCGWLAAIDEARGDEGPAALPALHRLA